jgi:hypothetical protein
MQCVEFPLRRVVDDASTNAFVSCFVADDVFVVIALPDNAAGSVAQNIDVFGRNRFECADQPT